MHRTSACVAFVGLRGRGSQAPQDPGQGEGSVRTCHPGRTRCPGPQGDFKAGGDILPAAAFRGRDGEPHAAHWRLSGEDFDPRCPAGAGQSKPGPWLFVTLVHTALHTRPEGGATPGCASDVSVHLQARPPPGTHEPLRAHIGPTLDPWRCSFRVPGSVAWALPEAPASALALARALVPLTSCPLKVAPTQCISAEKPVLGCGLGASRAPGPVSNPRGGEAWQRGCGRWARSFVDSV